MRTSANNRYHIEELSMFYESFVQEIVFQAIYVHADEPSPTRDILQNTDLKKYYQQWGQKGDYGLVAIHHASEQPVGGAFVRYYSRHQAGYGFVSEDIPELNIALLPDHRGKGLGTQLLERLLARLHEKRCKGVSLSVDTRNPARVLYERFGFRTVRHEGNPTMLLTLDAST